MRLLAILLALWLNRYHRRLDPYRRAAPVLRAAGGVRRALAGAVPGWDGPLGLILLLAPPVAVAVVVQVAVARAAPGLGELALSALALLFAVGAGRVEDHLQHFLEAWRRGDWVAARHAAMELDPELGGAEVHDLPERMIRALLTETLERIAGPLFWLLVLGPAGAVTYRLAGLARRFALGNRQSEPALARAAVGLCWLVGWLPTRALAGTFALAGSFAGAAEGWRRVSVVLTRDSNRELLVGAGLGALGLPPLRTPRDVTVTGVEDARQLVRRALMLWLAATALLTLAGWVP